MSDYMSRSLASELIKIRSQYLKECQQDEPTAEGLRQYVLELRQKDPVRFEQWALAALMEATTKFATRSMHMSDSFLMIPVSPVYIYSEPQPNEVVNVLVLEDGDISFHTSGSGFSFIISFKQFIELQDWLEKQ